MTSKSMEKLRGSSDKLQSINKLDADIRKVVRNAGKKKATGPLPKLEAQGPIDWSHQGIKSKYRGAKEREDAWHTWMQAVGLSRALLQDDHKILPVVKVERHPIYEQYHKLMEEENNGSNSRTRSRLLMKRFVFDVQEIWLTNLQHLREHAPGNIHSGEEPDDDYQRGEGIANRRDVKAITAMDHQVQSVSQRRVFANAYHTSRLPPIQVVLDYKPIPPPILSEARPLLPLVQPLMRNLLFRPNPDGSGFHYPTHQQLSNDPAYLLSIDRLVPSSDLAVSGTLPDVLWRVSLVDSQSLYERVTLTSEARVASFVSQLITMQMHVEPSEQEEDSSSAWMRYRSEQFVPVPFFDGTAEWEAQVEVALRRSTPNPHLPGLRPLAISITAYLRPYVPVLQQTPQTVRAQMEPPRVLSMQCTPAEVQAMLLASDHGVSAAAMTMGSLLSWEFWAAEERLKDCWIPLCCHCLGLETELFGDTQQVRREPVGLVLVPDNHMPRVAEEGPGPGLGPGPGRGHEEAVAPVGTGRQMFWERLEGALSEVQALSCCYELLRALELAHSAELVPSLRFALVTSQGVPQALAMTADRCDEDLKVALEPADPLNASPSPKAQRMLIQSLATAGRWEEVLRQCPMTLSMEAERLYERVGLVPGAMVMGRKGIWHADMNDPTRENTQVAATFFRDEARSTSDSVLVNLLLALDTAVRFPEVLAWEAVSQKPPAYPGEEIAGPVPEGAVRRNLVIWSQDLISPICDRPSQCVVIFAASAVEGMDYVDRRTIHIPAGCRRYVPTKNEYGFREQIEVRLLNVESHVATQIFGITRVGAIPNDTFANPRSVWHNTIAITEHINRPRLPRDYHYIVANPDDCGSNQATSYTTRMKADQMVGLTSSAFKLFEDAYQKIMDLRDVFGKQLALDNRIERLENEVKIKENARKRLIQDELQLALEKRLKKVTKSEAGWRKRLAGSSLIEVQGNWERRKDLRTGMIFFHMITPGSATGHEPQCCETCQWEVPAIWDSAQLWTEQDPAVRQINTIAPSLRSAGASLFSTETMARDLAVKLHDGRDPAFAEPPPSWAPYTQPGNRQSNQTKQLMNQGNSMALLNMKASGSLAGSSAVAGEYTAAAARNLDATAAALNGGSLVIRQQTASGAGGRGTGAQRMETEARTGVADDASVMSDLDSAAADRSLAESAAPTIDTANLEHIAEQLLSSDELMRVLARRLGIPEAQIVPADDLSSVFSVETAKRGADKTLNGTHDLDERLEAPRDKNAAEQYEPEFDSDDDLWSDDEHEVGDFDAGKEIAGDDALPQDLREATALRRREALGADGAATSTGAGSRGKSRPADQTSSLPSAIPFLDFSNVQGKSDRHEQMAAERFGWRRLPRPNLREGFLASALRTHTKGPDLTSCNTLNTPTFLLPISPVDACKYLPQTLAVPIETIFVPHVKRDVDRAVATMQRNIKKEQDLARALPGEDQLLSGEAKEFTSVEEFLNAQHKQQKALLDPKEAACERAILAAKNSNMAELEDALAEDIPINTADSFGNTLFILAAQQGARRVCKFLLRRGANINLQNHVGNTGLHYCYAYSHQALGEYLKAKGADDSILNVDGLTCYEGLNRDDMNKQYADYTDGDYAAAAGDEDAGEGLVGGDDSSLALGELGMDHDHDNPYADAFDAFSASIASRQ